MHVVTLIAPSIQDVHSIAQEDHLDEIIRNRRLSAVFQPIVNMGDASIVGFEGLIRGPSDSALHSPLMLFQAAHKHDRALDVEYLSRSIVLESFAKLNLSGKVFLNVSPDTLLMEGWTTGAPLRCIVESGLRPDQIVIELTENASSLEYSVLREATKYYRAMGFEIAMDDLGEGFSSLRMWSEIRPDFVKIDKHFIQNINLDPVKLQFVRSIQEIAKNSGCRVIAEGIETQAELVTTRDIGVNFGQGYHFAHPLPRPETHLAVGIKETLVGVSGLLKDESSKFLHRKTTVANLVRFVKPASIESTNDEVFSRFEYEPGLYSIPVVNMDKPVGLISRYSMIDRYARQFRKELFGRRSCGMMMDESPLIVDRSVTLHELSKLILEMEPYHLSSGFIITGNGKYLGMGSGHDLLREITQMQIAAARYANPLTGLPGNGPINEQIDLLLQNSVSFCACYFDLDSFKPYNDVYGFRKGDDLIKLVSTLLQEFAQIEIDFIGHIGGDDFIVLFQSEDWEIRCQNLLDRFGQVAPSYYEAEDLARNGIQTDSRQGDQTFYPIISLSVGAVKVDPNFFSSHYEVAAAATAAKKEAKKTNGNSLFLDRRIQIGS